MGHDPVPSLLSFPFLPATCPVRTCVISAVAPVAGSSRMVSPSRANRRLMICWWGLSGALHNHSRGADSRQWPPWLPELLLVLPVLLVLLLHAAAGKC